MLGGDSFITSLPYLSIYISWDRSTQVFAIENFRFSVWILFYLFIFTQAVMTDGVEVKRMIPVRLLCSLRAANHLQEAFNLDSVKNEARGCRCRVQTSSSLGQVAPFSLNVTLGSFVVFRSFSEEKVTSKQVSKIWVKILHSKGWLSKSIQNYLKF